MVSNSRDPSIVIIGAGMTGIAMVIKLRKAGITNITVLEKKNKIGGTWRENTYPGVACDVPAHMYTYSFEPNPNWSHFFAHGDEIQKYFEHVVEKYDVERSIHFSEAVTDARYIDGKWLVTSSKCKTYEADFMISATGILHHPAFPDIDGLNDFKGEMFHTAQWNHDVKIEKGKRVGVIGTGSTAAQAIPELIKAGAEVTVFQRTPQWILPLKNFAYSNRTKRLMNKFPLLPKLTNKLSIFVMQHLFTKAVTGHFLQKKFLEICCKANLFFAVKDKVLRTKLRPNYKVGCKRVVINKTFYEGIQKENANLTTEGIDKITDKGVLTKDGKLHELDVLVLSTGFHPFNFMRPMNLVGREELHIEEAWSDHIQAYRSLMLPKYPNFFLMLGPYTPIGNFSVIAMSEVQGDYIIKVVDEWRKGRYDEVEAKVEAVNDFSTYVKAGLKKTAWVGGCKSWYLDSDGDPVLWPYTWSRWVKEMKEPRFQDMHLEKLSSADRKKVA